MSKIKISDDFTLILLEFDLNVFHIRTSCDNSPPSPAPFLPEGTPTPLLQTRY